MNQLRLRASCSQKSISICMISSFLNVICKIFIQRLHIHIEYWRFTQIFFCGIPIDPNTKTCVLVCSFLFAKFVNYSNLYPHFRFWFFLLLFSIVHPQSQHTSYRNLFVSEYFLRFYKPTVIHTTTIIIIIITIFDNQYYWP